MSRAALALATLAVALAGYATVTNWASNGAARGNTDVRTIVRERVQQLASDNGLSVVKITLLAYRHHGNTTVAMVKLVYRQGQLDPWSGNVVTVQRVVVLHLHLERSPWLLSGFWAEQ